MANHTHRLKRPNAAFRRLLSGAALVLALLVAAPSAHAQWAVNDAEANQHLGEIESHTNDTATNTKDTVTQTTNLNNVLGTKNDTYSTSTVNGRLDSINRKFQIGNYDDKKPGARVANPTQALPASGGPPLDDGSSCNTVAQPQQATCKQIVDLENAKYKYMLLMYETTATRDTTLRDLLTERENIASGDQGDISQYGKLEDNTNKLTALYNLIALDHQQMESVNYAYDANIRYLRAKQTLAANSAATGKDPSSTPGGIDIPGVGNVQIGQLISGFVTGAALSVALDGVATSKPSGMKTLKIGESNGY